VGRNILIPMMTDTISRPRMALTAAGVAALVLLGGTAPACVSSPLAAQQRGPAGEAASQGIVVDETEMTRLVTASAGELMAPAVVVVLLTPVSNFELALGTRDLEGTTPVTTDDHIRIGSNTKTFTGTVILQLAQEGRLNLEGPVSTYWPGVPNGERITIAQLLTMRSGLFNYSETLELNRSLDQEPGRIWTPSELLRLGLSREPYFPPGEGYHYSNTNTVLLGLIAEKIEGKPLPQIIQERLLEPLNLSATSFPPSDNAVLPDPHPRGYMHGTNVDTMDSAALPPAQQAAAAAGELLPSDVTDENPSWTWAAGQMISTAPDLVRWAQALGDGRLLSPQWQRKRLGSLRSTDPSQPSAAQYGLGLARLGPMVGHTGELPGFNSFMGYDPDNGVALVVWSNLGAAPNGMDVATSIAKTIIGRIYPATSAVPAPEQ
jgi:D-alanyl-D-alanine carboxypeptidase